MSVDTLPFMCGYCGCKCGTDDSLYSEDQPGRCGCGQSEFAGDALSLDELRTTLQQRLVLLDAATLVEIPGTPVYDEVCARYYECKTILELVNRVG